MPRDKAARALLALEVERHHVFLNALAAVVRGKIRSEAKDRALVFPKPNQASRFMLASRRRGDGPSSRSDTPRASANFIRYDLVQVPVPGEQHRLNRWRRLNANHEP